MNFELRNFQKPQETSKNNQQLNLLKCVQENVPVILWKYWQEVKSKPIFLVSQKHLIWAFELNQ